MYGMGSSPLGHPSNVKYVGLWVFFYLSFNFWFNIAVYYLL